MDGEDNNYTSNPKEWDGSYQVPPFGPRGQTPQILGPIPMERPTVPAVHDGKKSDIYYYKDEENVPKTRIDKQNKEQFLRSLVSRSSNFNEKYKIYDPNPAQKYVNYRDLNFILLSGINLARHFVDENQADQKLLLTMQECQKENCSLAQEIHDSKDDCMSSDDVARFRTLCENAAAAIRQLMIDVNERRGASNQASAQSPPPQPQPNP
ncbi:MAG: hypothetical protein Q9227_006551 [Pyrenula ochraceoflavens]